MERQKVERLNKSQTDRKSDRQKGQDIMPDKQKERKSDGKIFRNDKRLY